MNDGDSQHPPEEWAEFFDELSDQVEARQVTVEAIGEDAGDQIVARDMTLQGITLDEKGSGQGEITIMLGDDPAKHIAHVIGAPSHVSVLEDEAGDPQTLQIEAAGGPTTLVHFQRFAETSHSDETVALEDEDE